MSEKEITVWLTKQLRLFIPIKDNDSAQIAALFKCRTVSRGDYLLKEGQYGDWWGTFLKRSILQKNHKMETRKKIALITGCQICE